MNMITAVLIQLLDKSDSYRYILVRYRATNNMHTSTSQQSIVVPG
jgi:hypothetical protein